nr:hypothetical protein BgiMline_012994 [Biomphalaria glabrata]
MILILFFGQMANWTTVSMSSTSFERRATCRDILTTMVVGKWLKKPHSKEEISQINKFLHAVREHLFLPYSLEREDKLCGNVTFEELNWRMHDLHWFRALCNPDGDTPCCYNNRCVAKDADDCYCDSCYDMRQPIHAELATWSPTTYDCQMATFTSAEDVCHLLSNVTLYIIGDSLLRHVYVSLLTLIRSDTIYGPLLQYTSPGVIQMCNGDFLHLPMCVNHIDRDTWACDRTVRLKFFEYVRSSQSNLTLAAISELMTTPNSLVLVGIGIHDNFNSTSILNDLVFPMVKIASHSKWPRIVWSATHSFGIMKSPRIVSQNIENVIHFNEKIKAALRGSGIPIFDTFQLTNGTMSFDGVHYGKGVNDVKAQIFLNYIMEERELGHLENDV